jgi:hypothetical protein
MPAPPRTGAAPEAQGWLTPLICGVLWGCALTGIETLREPPAGLPAGTMAAFLLSMTASWCLAGVGWAVAAEFAARRPSPGRLVLIWVSGALVLTGLQAAVDIIDLFGGGQGVSEVLGAQLPLDARLSHLLWLNAVFGGLYVAGYAGFQRAVRSRRRLAWLQRALSDEAALLEEARLHSLRGSLEPQILLQAVRALRARYEADPTAADLLLDRLVAYLRAAIGSGGAQPFTANREPRAAQAYRALLRTIDGGRAAAPFPQPLDDRSLP